jgi:hypothetical protein
MNEIFEQPHQAAIVTPARTRDAGNNAGELSYTVPPATTFTVRCMLQMRGGSRLVQGEGAAYPVDAIMYTSDTRVNVDDLVSPLTPQGMNLFRFVIVNVMYKYDVDGALRHVQCQLTRTQKL